MTLFYIVSKIKRDIENQVFHTPAAFDVPVKGIPSNFAIIFRTENLKYSLFEDMLTRSDRSHKRDSRMDGRTDTPRYSKPRYMHSVSR